ncbi:MAG: DUF1638 domain-containing protein [Ilumatobacteraceae bacterium]
MQPMPPLVLACGALVRELRAVLTASDLADRIEVDYLPAPLHNRPDRIVPAIEERLATVEPDRPVLLGYADCGTGGLLDAYIERSTRRIGRLPGAHCYEFFAGSDRFAELHEQEIGTFYLTDYLARHFDALVWQGLGLDRHPELIDMLFSNYRRVVLLQQSDDPAVVESARAAADRLGLELVVESTGLERFAEPIRLQLREVVPG